MARNSLQSAHGPSLAPYSEEPVSTPGVTTNSLAHTRCFPETQARPAALGGAELETKGGKTCSLRGRYCLNTTHRPPPTSHLPLPSASSPHPSMR